MLSRLKSLALGLVGVYCVAFGASEFSHKPYHWPWLLLDIAGGGIVGATVTWRPRHG